MWAECAFFYRNTECCRGTVDRSGQSGERWSGLNPDPKHSRRFCRRKKSMSTKAHGNGIGLHRCQTLLDLFYNLGRFLSDEFQGHMQRFWPNPARIGRKLTHPIHKTLNALADSVVYIEGNENTHSRWSLVAG